MTQAELIDVFDRLLKGRSIYEEIEEAKDSSIKLAKAFIEVGKATEGRPLGGENLVRLEFYMTLLEATAAIAKEALHQAETQYKRATSALVTEGIMMALGDNESQALKLGKKNISAEFDEAVVLLGLRIEELTIVRRKVDERAIEVLKMVGVV